MITHTLIITTYNRPDALELVLNSVTKQSCLPYEVIIADDGSTEDTKSLIDRYRSLLPNVKHVWQEDIGFRLARIRNLALSASSGQFISMIDGDMALHHDFLKDIQKHIQPGFYLQGKRVLLNRKITDIKINNHDYYIGFFAKGIINRFNTLSIPFLSKMVSRTYNSIKSVKGCSMHFWKKDAETINGFNEAFVGWGREDSEFLCRLLNSGVKRKNLALGAVAYHLYHNVAPRTTLPTNDKILEECIKEKKIRCEKGLVQS